MPRLPFSQMWHILAVDHAHKGEPCLVVSKVLEVPNFHLFKPLLTYYLLTKHTLFYSMACVSSFGSRTEDIYYSPCGHLEVPSTDTLFKGICVVAAERGENVRMWEPSTLSSWTHFSKVWAAVCSTRSFLTLIQGQQVYSPGWPSTGTWTFHSLIGLWNCLPEECWKMDTYFLCFLWKAFFIAVTYPDSLVGCNDWNQGQTVSLALSEEVL